MWNHKTPGIPDEEFERTEEVPITKEEVRAIQISKARLSLGQTVYAIDFDLKAVELTKKNLEKFGVSNVKVILGNAKEKISELPEADAIFIGGTGGDTKEIIELCHIKLKSGGRIVIGVILIETLFSVLEIMNKLDFTSVDITQITISKSRKTSAGTMMLARNPVTVISATKF